MPQRVVVAQIQIRASKDLEQLEARLDALAAGELLNELLRTALVQSVLSAWRKRALANFEDALRMERDFSGSSNRQQVDPVAAKKARKALVNASEALAEEQLTGKATAATKKKLRKAAERFVAAHESPTGASELATGRFRILALKAVALLTDASRVQMAVGQNKLTAGIGNISVLDAVHTPSATPQLTGHDTGSSMTKLWRQLEFGTGVYGLGTNKSAFSMGDGSWWFGPRRGFGLHLKGSRPLGAIFDRATKLPYDADAIRFETVFAGLLVNALVGK